MKKKPREIKDYDEMETSEWIDPSKKLTLKDLGLKLPPNPPTQVLSIRLPTRLLNQIKAQASTQDIPYQTLIKLALSKTFGSKAVPPA